MYDSSGQPAPRDCFQHTCVRRVVSFPQKAAGYVFARLADDDKTAAQLELLSQSLVVSLAPERVCVSSAFSWTTSRI